MSITLQEYLRATAVAVHGTLFQRLGMRSLPGVDSVGDARSVEGLTVVVTGPTAGIGRATAAALARRGAHGGFWACDFLVPELLISRQRRSTRAAGPSAHTPDSQKP
jgi:hypothetical protein